jgi:hypothetical protein
MKNLIRTPYNTTINALLLKKLKVLAAEKEKRHNDILEEAIADILKKYGKKVPKRVYSTST